MAIEASNGARVGNYVLVRKLGEGGMAEVWLVRHAATAQLRAMKFLNAQFSGIPEVEARFQNEGENQLIHPNIVRIYEVGQQSGSSYLAMDFIDGRDLEKIMDSRRGPLMIPEAVDIGIQILAGLGFAHSNGIVHRDIKPSNVLVDEEGQAYLMDFGIAKVIRSTRNVTQVNARLGTPDYMSPEQIRSSRDVDSRSDIYSFGCLFYELLTGWPPFDKNSGYESVHDIQTAHITEPPTPPIERRSGLPVELNDIALYCLAKAKEDRPQTCEEIIVALEAYRATAAKAPPPSRATMPMQRTSPGTGPAPWIPELPRPDLPKPELPQSVAPKSTTGPGTGPANRPSPSPPPLYSTGPQVAQAPPPPPQSKTPAPVSPDPVFRPVVQTPPPVPQKPVYTPQARTETVLDSPFPATPVAAPTPSPLRTPPSVPAKASATAPPAQMPAVPVNNAGLYTRPAAGPEIKKEPAKLNPMLLAAAAVLLLGALGGGGWLVFHKPAPPPPAPHVDPPKADVNPNPKKDPAPGNNANNADPNKKLPPTPAVGPATGPGGIPDHRHDIPRKDPVLPPGPAKATSGTLTWTGNITSPMQQFVDIYLHNQAASVGAVAASTFPTQPVTITVPSGNAVVVSQPSANRNYSTFRIHVNGEGQQTVTLQWTELPQQ